MKLAATKIRGFSLNTGETICLIEKLCHINLKQLKALPREAVGDDKETTGDLMP